ncbi:hypothetical protein RvY_11597 [Ramazzottius varieornatus]|uniref:Long-chain-fatty-acid--CoA ligase n=1 Tax=Ramazzottius varieornatus TaxID=947166 RepID=A0A1D1VGQ1_RAMVA|nr:hypothetical protein RvY_11597 [Ramazzottius varieornatus]
MRNQIFDNSHLRETLVVLWTSSWLSRNTTDIIAVPINTNVQDEALKHVIITANAKVVIVGQDLLDDQLSIQPDLPTVQRTLLLCENRDLTEGKTDLPCLDELLKEQSPTKPEVRRAVGYCDTVYYIYTSGTTNLGYLGHTSPAPRPNRLYT